MGKNMNPCLREGSYFVKLLFFPSVLAAKDFACAVALFARTVKTRTQIFSVGRRVGFARTVAHID